MPTDATGTPTTHVGIPKFNTSADAPSGLGSNAAMDALDALLSGTQALSTLGWGPTSGGAAIDTTLTRSAAQTLATAANFRVDASGVGGRLYFGAAADTSLYSAAAAVLATDGDMIIAGKIRSSSPVAANTNAVQAGYKIPFYAANGTLLGYAQLYTG